jgi:hypothetical protein
MMKPMTVLKKAIDIALWVTIASFVLFMIANPTSVLTISLTVQ